ncbi:MAG TPA: EAL domain-containing protein, partial [Actinomycetota bacterium]
EREREERRLEAEGARRVSPERIREVIERGEIVMVCQPVVNLRDGFVMGVEALARFHAEPLMGPDRWFAAAEASGLRLELELAAVKEGVRAFDSLPPELFLAVNVSPDTAASAELAAIVDAVDASRLVLEITEHAAVEDYDTLEAVLGDLRRRGVSIAIDDAGAGYASLRHILQLGPDLIKLDMSLTRDIDRRPRHQSLISALVTFAVGTGAQMVSEGIETRDELDTLQALRVPMGQGYLLARPGPIPRDWVRPMIDVGVDPVARRS